MSLLWSSCSNTICIMASCTSFRQFLPKFFCERISLAGVSIKAPSVWILKRLIAFMVLVESGISDSFFSAWNSVCKSSGVILSIFSELNIGSKFIDSSVGGCLNIFVDDGTVNTDCCDERCPASINFCRNWFSSLNVFLPQLRKDNNLLVSQERNSSSEVKFFSKTFVARTDKNDDFTNDDQSVAISANISLPVMFTWQSATAILADKGKYSLISL